MLPGLGDIRVKQHVMKSVTARTVFSVNCVSWLQGELLVINTGTPQHSAQMQRHRQLYLCQRSAHDLLCWSSWYVDVQQHHLQGTAAV